MKKEILMLLVITTLFVIKLKAQSSDNLLTDSRDGKTYKTVKIGTQTWMAENLNYSTKSGSWSYDNQKENCDKYGRLYDWETAKTACPTGWILPSDKEWYTLVDYLGGNSIAGNKLKSKSGWDSPNSKATNESGFNAVPGGYLVSSKGLFQSKGEQCHWWSSPDTNDSYAWSRFLSSGSSSVSKDQGSKEYGFSVRCMRN
jgi:uncharacterized protein (TIGR02145 family)